MTPPAKVNKKKIITILPLLLIGAGLIVLGLVAAKVISTDGFNNDFSVVPSQVNFPAPELTLNSINGEKVSISDYLPDIVLINNWATWCPPCRDEMPTLSKYYDDHSTRALLL